MKIKNFFFVIIITFTSCDNASEKPGKHCFGISNYEVCNADPECGSTVAYTEIIDNDGYIIGYLGKLYKNMESYSSVCFPNSYFGDGIDEGNYPIAKFVTPNIILYSNHDGNPYDSDPDFQEEYGWYWTGDIEFVQLAKGRLFQAICGDGIIHPGEQCDATQLGNVEECSKYSELTQDGSYTEGTISCDELCQWDFSECISEE